MNHDAPPDWKHSVRGSPWGVGRFPPERKVRNRNWDCEIEETFALIHNQCNSEELNFNQGNNMIIFDVCKLQINVLMFYDCKMSTGVDIG